MPDLIQIIKRAAMEAMAAANPCSILFGTVSGTTPLEITIEQRLTVDESFLILTSAVSDHSVQVSDSISGKRTLTILSGLIVGESVLLMQVQGGQKYIVLDRLGGVVT